MKVDKATELFQTMAIVSLNMMNLTLEVNILKHKLVTREKEKAMLQDKLDKERVFQKRYKHNVEILRKKKVEVKWRNIFIKKLQDENEELKDNTSWQKSQDEKLENSKQKAEIWETIERRWIETLFFHKKQ